MNQIINSFMPHLSLDSEYFTDEYYKNIIDGIEDEEESDEFITI